MPGELGNEEEQPMVGYYERRYTPNGEWMVQNYGKGNVWNPDVPSQNTMKGLVERLRKKDKSDGKSKCRSK